MFSWLKRVTMRLCNRQRQAAAREAAYQQQTAAIQAQYATIAQQNQEAAEEAQARFEEQLSQSREASAATIAGLENLLIDQQNAAKAQAAQLAEQAAAAEQRYTSQLTRQARLDTAYVPENQPVASAPLVGDQRKPKTGTRTNTLSQLSIVSNPGGNAVSAIKGTLNSLVSRSPDERHRSNKVGSPAGVPADGTASCD